VEEDGKGCSWSWGGLSVAVVSLVPLVPARDACWSAGYATVSQLLVLQRAEVLVQREEWGSQETSLPFSRSLAAVSHLVAVLSFRAVVWSQSQFVFGWCPSRPRLA
jgi:hypothetical protein